MTKDLIVSTTPQETKVALLEDGVVSEFFIEREAHRGIVGNIYKGRVTRVLPGMQSAFVDLGARARRLPLRGRRLRGPRREPPHSRGAGAAAGTATATPHRGDGSTRARTCSSRWSRSPGDEGGAHHLPRLAAGALPRLHAHRRARGGLAQDHGRRGASPPQVAPQGDPPGAGRRGASSRAPRAPAAAARTSSGTARYLDPDLGRGAGAVSRASRRRALLHRELGLVQRLLRDILSEEVASIRLDTREGVPADARPREPAAAGAARRASACYDRPAGDLRGARGDRRAGARPALQGVARLRRLHRHQPDGGPRRHRRQHRPLHGQEEARGHHPARPTWRRSRRLVRQIRLRDLGGIIVVDFIDMEERKSRQKVMAALEQELKTGSFAVEGPVGERVRPGDPHPQARAAVAGAHAVPALPLLHRERDGEERGHGVLGDLRRGEEARLRHEGPVPPAAGPPGGRPRAPGRGGARAARACGSWSASEILVQRRPPPPPGAVRRGGA